MICSSDFTAAGHPEKESDMNFRARFFFSVLAALTLAAVLLPVSAWAQGNFVYTNDDQSVNTISAFSAAADGTLTAVPGTPFTTGGTGSGGGLFSANRIAVSSAGNLLFAANTGSDDISVFKIDPATGALTAVAGSPFATGNHPVPPGNGRGISVAATPDGKFLMAASNASANIAVFSIGPTGALSLIPGSPFATGGNPSGIKISPDGKSLAVATNNVEMFSIGSNGVLTSVGVFASGTPRGVDIDCASSHVFIGEPNATGTIVDVFTMGSNGALTAVPGSPFSPPSGTNSNVVLLSPDDKTLFVSNQISSTVTVLSVASDGSLTLLPGSPFPMSLLVTSPSGMATSQDGTLLYVAEANPAISVFKVAANGTLTEAPGSPFFMEHVFGMHSLTAFPPKTCGPNALTVQIEIKPPAAPPVPINPLSPGKIPVAILSTPTFNAVTQVDRHSLTFGHTGNEASLAFCNRDGEDVNNDGLPDLVCHFRTPLTGFVAGDTNAVLKGKTVTGTPIQGSEAIRTVPPHGYKDRDRDNDRH